MKEKRKGENNKYFIVEAKCGHVGKQFYIPIKFAITAKSAKEAAEIIRQIPRVKHDHKDAILNVEKVSFEEYLTQQENNSKIDYLKCKSKYEQKNILDWIENNKIEETEVEYKYRLKDKYYFDDESSFVYKFGKCIRNLKKYTKYNLQENFAYW